MKRIILAALVPWPAIAMAAEPPSAVPFGLSAPSPPSKPSPPLVCSTPDSLLQIREGSSITGPMTVEDNAGSGGITIEVLPGLELKGPIKIEACDGRVIISKD